MATESQTGAESAPDTGAEPKAETAGKAKRPSSRVTRELPAIDMSAEGNSSTTLAATDGGATTSGSAFSDEDDPDATVNQRAVRPTPVSRPRKATLAMAITRPSASNPNAANESALTASSQQRRTSGAGTDATLQVSSRRPEATDALKMSTASPDEVADEVDEWAVSDQPTVYLAPRPPRRSRPNYLETGDAPSWPKRPAPSASATPTPAPMLARPPMPSSPAPRHELPQRADAARPLGQPRLAAPDGRLMPGTPPEGIPRAALPNPRSLRFQELRRQRINHEEGERDPGDAKPVSDVVRQWWSDLRPGLGKALDYQHEARESGVYPIPAYDDVPATGLARLGDAFGRLTASARELTERAQAAAAPTLKRLQDQAGRLHNQAEQAAQTFVERIEGPAERQQAPLLGPGRIAIFFRPGVTVGQAQSLLGACGARPIRLIPRKHGFLARVTPGNEEEISERLRIHPYVRDVAYLDYNEYGQASGQS